MRPLTKPGAVQQKRACSPKGDSGKQGAARVNAKKAIHQAGLAHKEAFGLCYLQVPRLE